MAKFPTPRLCCLTVVPQTGAVLDVIVVNVIEYYAQPSVTFLILGLTSVQHYKTKRELLIIIVTFFLTIIIVKHDHYICKQCTNNGKLKTTHKYITTFC